MKEKSEWFRSCFLRIIHDCVARALYVRVCVCMCALLIFSILSTGKSIKFPFIRAHIDTHTWRQAQTLSRKDREKSENDK